MRELTRPWGEDIGLLAHRRVAAQQPSPVPVTGTTASPPEVLEDVVAVAEEGEVVVGHPAQEGRGAADLVGVQPDRGRPLELGGNDQAAGAHLGPVLDRLAHVGEDATDRRLEVGQGLLVGFAVDRQQHPGLVDPSDGVTHTLPRFGVLDRLQTPRSVTTDDELRVDEQVDVEVLADDGIGHRVDEEGHVVGDDLDDRTGAGPPVDVGRGVEHPHVGSARLADLGELTVGRRHAGERCRRTGPQLVGRDVSVEPAHEVSRVPPPPNFS